MNACLDDCLIVNNQSLIFALFLMNTGAWYSSLAEQRNYGINLLITGHVHTNCVFLKTKPFCLETLKTCIFVRGNRSMDRRDNLTCWHCVQHVSRLCQLLGLLCKVWMRSFVTVRVHAKCVIREYLVLLILLGLYESWSLS